MRSSTPQDKIFVTIADGLSQAFPALDLRFNRAEDAKYMRCLLPDVTDEVLEFALEGELHSLLNQAILDIKAVARLFDA